jgi:hypothetical protein
MEKLVAEKLAVSGSARPCPKERAMAKATTFANRVDANSKKLPEKRRYTF